MEMLHAVIGATNPTYDANPEDIQQKYNLYSKSKRQLGKSIESESQSFPSEQNTEKDERESKSNKKILHDIWKSNINECSSNPILQAKWVHKPTHPTNVF